MLTKEIHKQKTLVAFIVALPNISPWKLIPLTNTLYRASGVLARYNVMQCNQPLTPYQIKRVKLAEKEVKETCLRLGVEVDTDGDPRGYTVKVKMLNGASNELGGMWGIE